LQAKKEREEAGYRHNNLIQGSESLASEHHNIPSERIQKEDAAPDDEDESMLGGVSIGNMAGKNQFQGFLVEQILKITTTYGNPKVPYIIDMNEVPDDS
jgi:hypothetical protein